MMRLQFHPERFLANMERIVNQVVPAAAVEGMKKAIFKHFDDAIAEFPAVPWGDELTNDFHPGRLIGSGSCFVNDQLVAIGPNIGGSPNPVTSYNPLVRKDETVASVIFNTPYAAYQHEGQRPDGSHVIRRWTMTESGTKFLEAKLLAHSLEYFQFVASAIKGAS